MTVERDNCRVNVSSCSDSVQAQDFVEPLTSHSSTTIRFFFCEASRQLLDVVIWNITTVIHGYQRMNPQDVVGPLTPPLAPS